MNPQVLTRMTSASSSARVTAAPCPTQSATRRSESTVALSQPRERTPSFTMGRKLAEEALQRSRLRDVAEAGEGLLLDLADPFAGDAQQRADLLERHRLLAVEPEVEPQDLRLP